MVHIRLPPGRHRNLSICSTVVTKRVRWYRRNRCQVSVFTRWQTVCCPHLLYIAFQQIVS